MKKSIVFKGLFPAIVTPFNEDGSMNLEGLKDNVKFYMSAGCSGVCFSGSTGEHANLSRQERIDGIKAIKEVIGDGKIISGAGASNTAGALEIVKDVKEAGADAALIYSPNASATDDGMVKHFETLAQAGLPLLLYNYPAATGIDISFELFSRLIAIPEVVGMKESSGNLPLLMEILRNYSVDEITLFSGSDDLILPAAAVGLKAMILATGGIVPEKVIGIFKYVEEGNMAKAREINDSIMPLVSVIGSEDNFPSRIKKAASLIGRASGDPRLPILPVSDEDEAEIKSVLKIAGYDL